jgi:hypothetical protein
MKFSLGSIIGRALALMIVAGAALGSISTAAAGQPPGTIPWDEVGPRAGAQYRGDGLAVSAIESGARLSCVFQTLEGEVSTTGLWLVSTEGGATDDRFQVLARAVGRADTGVVVVADQRARFIRSGLVEEYSVSVDGVRQDFVVLQPPAGRGALRVELDVAGARVKAVTDGALLVLAGTGREISYSHLHVTDAHGRALGAHIEGVATNRFAVVVDDADAVYPVRIDPIFADANWSALGAGVNNGVNGPVRALALSGTDLYVGGLFTKAGGVSANRIAKWNGSAWSKVGGSGVVNNGLSNYVNALAVSGDFLYAGCGDYIPPGYGFGSNYIAKLNLNGGPWTALGSGLNSHVTALLVHDGYLYVGGAFSKAGGHLAGHVARWDLNGIDDNTAWSTVGTGIPGGPTSGRVVRALAWSSPPDDVLYAGGSYTGGHANPGPTFKGQIAQWSPLTGLWSPVGSGFGVNTAVYALAVNGTTLYAGGTFTTAGGSPANYVAMWNGSQWLPLVTPQGLNGVNGPVGAVAVSGTDLYVGGSFTMAGDIPANHIATWALDGSGWSAVGTGLDAAVAAVGVSGADLYAGGYFTTAGAGSVSANHVAKRTLGGAPGTVAKLLVAMQGNGDVILTWTPSCEPTDNDYEIYEGTAPYNHKSRFCTTEGATSWGPFTPDPSPFVYWIVVPRNPLNKEGSYGTYGANHTQRPQGDPFCLPQEIGCP